MTLKPEAIVGTDWLDAHLHDADVRIVDATFLLPPTPRDARAEYAAAHIPGAVFFDIEGISDHSTALPHMLPSAEAFAVAVGALGIGNAHHVVLYDNATMAGAARVWWTFRAFGHARVSVLDGGLPKWRREGRALTAIPTAVSALPFRATLQPARVRSRADILANLAAPSAWVVDARSAGRFAGRDPEPRPGLRGGHIPGALNVPFGSLLDSATQTYLPREQLRAVFAAAGLPEDAPVITSCGSGVTASVLALALHHIGRGDVAVYDGSWAEWGADAALPLE